MLYELLIRREKRKPLQYERTNNYKQRAEVVMKLGAKVLRMRRLPRGVAAVGHGS